MEDLTDAQNAVLEVIEAQLGRINKRLKKFEPLIAERDRLTQTRRVLLSEKSQTGGRGSWNAQLSGEEVITFLRENGPSTPQEISEGLSVAGTVVRSHLSRGKGKTYDRNDDGKWDLIEGDEEDDEEEE